LILRITDSRRENEKGWRGGRLGGGGKGMERGEVRRRGNGVYGKIMQYIRYQDT